MIMISDLLAAGRPGHAGPGHRDGDLSLRELVAAGNLKLNMNAFFQVSPRWKLAAKAQAAGTWARELETEPERLLSS